MKPIGSNLKYCPHKYLIPKTLALWRSRQPAAVLPHSRDASPYCLQCWNDREVATVFQPMFDRPAADDPCTYGFCDLIQSVARKRGFLRDQDQLENVELELRAHLIAQKATLEAALAGKSEEHRANYVRKVLQNYLTNTQTRSEAIVARKSIKSLSPDGSVKTYRKQAWEALAAQALVEETDGDSAAQCDDHSLDEKDTVHINDPEKLSVKEKQPATHLFDNRLYEASSLIATLTGSRDDGFDTYLDLRRALTKLSADEVRVFAGIYLDENGELLNRPRTYGEIEDALNLTTQNVRTLERRAIEKLRSALSPRILSSVPGLDYCE